MASHRSFTSRSIQQTTNTVLTAPSGLANDDILILAWSCEADVTPTPPSGFAQLIDIDHASVANDLFVWWKRAASESGSYTVTHSLSWTEAYLVAVQSASTTADPTVGSGNSGTGTTTTALGVTPAGNDAWIGFMASMRNDGGASTPPSGSTPTFDERYNPGNSFYAADGTLATAGATGNKTITTNTTDWMAVLVVVEDATPPAPNWTIRYDYQVELT